MDRGFALQQISKTLKKLNKTIGCSGAWWEVPAHDDRVLPASDETLLVNFGFKSSTYAQPSISSQSGPSFTLLSTLAVAVTVNGPLEVPRLEKKWLAGQKACIQSKNNTTPKHLDFSIFRWR